MDRERLYAELEADLEEYSASDGAGNPPNSAGPTRLASLTGEGGEGLRIQAPTVSERDEALPSASPRRSSTSDVMHVHMYLQGTGLDTHPHP